MGLSILHALEYKKQDHTENFLYGYIYFNI